MKLSKYRIDLFISAHYCGWTRTYFFVNDGNNHAYGIRVI